MKLQLSISLGLLVVTSLIGPAAMADQYSSITTTNECAPITETRETTTTVQTAPATTVIREQPVYVERNPEVIVVKKHHHHLINLGPVKVF